MAQVLTDTPPATYKVAQPTRSLDALRPHPDNPREEISPDDPKIIEMADSIERHGIIEPLVITPDGTLIAGHRRRVAARVAARRGRPDLMLVPVVIREIEPEAALELMLHENMQRESLSPLEEARAMYSIMDRRKLTVGDMARLISVPISTCSQRLAILKCEPEVQRLYATRDMPTVAAPFLAHVASAEKQINYAGMLARRTLTVQKLKEIVRDDPQTVRGTGQRRSAKPGGQDSTQTTAEIPKPRINGIHTTERQAVVTRAAAEASLNKVITRKISMHAFRAVLETICCACGMKGQDEVCMSCPLPRLVLGVAGRTELS